MSDERRQMDAGRRCQTRGHAQRWQDSRGGSRCPTPDSARAKKYKLALQPSPAPREEGGVIIWNAAMNQALRAMQKRGYTIQKAEQIFGLSQKIIRMHAHDMKLPPFRGDSL